MSDSNHDTMRAFVEAELARIHGSAPQFEIVRLPGDASDRRYYRVAAGDDAPDYILMEILNLESSLKSEEVTLYHDTSGELPFLNVHRFLASLGFPVPAIHRYDPDALLMLLEDLGERLLFDLAEGDGVDAAWPYYEQAIDLLAGLHARATRDAPGAASCMAFRQRFAEPLLDWEFDHFLEYRLETKGVVVDPDDAEKIRRRFHEISTEVAAAPVVFTHRDYHAKNLVLNGGRLGLIDFQDALLGPPTYDLVSLVRDSYVPLPDERVKQLIDRYVTRASAAGVPGTGDAAAFARLYHLTTLQRSLKVAGRFEYIAQVKKNRKFLPYVPVVLGFARDALAALEDFDDLKNLLVRYAPELE